MPDRRRYSSLAYKPDNLLKFSSFSVRWVTTLTGDIIWEWKRKEMVINDFVRSLHQDEKTLASEFKDQRGVDWNKYTLEKEKAGFAKFDQWWFINQEHIKIQLNSKYKFKWELENVIIETNGRLVRTKVFAVSVKKSEKRKFKQIGELIREGGDNRASWIEELIRPFEPVGYGISFTAPLNQTDMKTRLIVQLNGVGEMNLRKITALWTTNDDWTLILHDDDEFD